MNTILSFKYVDVLVMICLTNVNVGLTFFPFRELLVFRQNLSDLIVKSVFFDCLNPRPQVSVVVF